MVTRAVLNEMRAFAPVASPPITSPAPNDVPEPSYSHVSPSNPSTSYEPQYIIENLNYYPEPCYSPVFPSNQSTSYDPRYIIENPQSIHIPIDTYQPNLSDELPRSNSPFFSSNYPWHVPQTPTPPPDPSPVSVSPYIPVIRSNYPWHVPQTPTPPPYPSIHIRSSSFSLPGPFHYTVWDDDDYPPNYDEVGHPPRCEDLYPRPDENSELGD